MISLAAIVGLTVAHAYMAKPELAIPSVIADVFVWGVAMLVGYWKYVDRA